jgi:predicted DNA-binding protein
MSSKSTTIRVTNQVRETVREISEITGKRQLDVVDEAVEAYRRHILLERANQAYSALRSDSKAWQTEIEEREAWDATLEDGAEES